MKKSLRSLLSGTSAVLDIAFEITGRRVNVLQKTAAFLYDKSQKGAPSQAKTSGTDSAPRTPEEPLPTTQDHVVNDVEETEASGSSGEGTEAAPVVQEAVEVPVVEAPVVDTARAEYALEEAEGNSVTADLADESVVSADAVKTEEDTETTEVPAQPFPIEGYNTLNVREVESALEGLDAVALKRVQEHEENHKKRVTALRAIQRALESQEA